MADFELELELIARIDDLERGMKGRTESGRAILGEEWKRRRTRYSEGAFTPLIEKIAKVAAGLFLAERRVQDRSGFGSRVRGRHRVDGGRLLCRFP